MTVSNTELCVIKPLRTLAQGREACGPSAAGRAVRFTWLSSWSNRLEACSVPERYTTSTTVYFLIHQPGSLMKQSFIYGFQSLLCRFSRCSASMIIAFFFPSGVIPSRNFPLILSLIFTYNLQCHPLFLLVGCLFF